MPRCCSSAPRKKLPPPTTTATCDAARARPSAICRAMPAHDVGVDADLAAAEHLTGELEQHPPGRTVGLDGRCCLGQGVRGHGASSAVVRSGHPILSQAGALTEPRNRAGCRVTRRARTSPAGVAQHELLVGVAAAPGVLRGVDVLGGHHVLRANPRQVDVHPLRRPAGSPAAAPTGSDRPRPRGTQAALEDAWRSRHGGREDTAWRASRHPRSSRARIDDSACSEARGRDSPSTGAAARRCTPSGGPIEPVRTGRLRQAAFGRGLRRRDRARCLSQLDVDDDGVTASADAGRLGRTAPDVVLRTT